MTKTKIEWTDATWNPVTGCSKVSPGCEHCFAETMDRRIRGKDGEEFKSWTLRNAEYNVRLHPERLEAPLHWRKPRRVFVNSMSDLFHEQVPVEFIDKVFAVMALTPQHTYQILTKRPERMREYLRQDALGSRLQRVSGIHIHPEPKVWEFALAHIGWKMGAAEGYERLFRLPLPNVWLGVSVEDQRRADERIPILLDTPAAVRFVSAEPLLGPVDLTFPGHIGALEPDWAGGIGGGTGHPHPLLDWVIVGGESGPGARPCHVEWVRSVVRDCWAASVPVFVKQLGARPHSHIEFASHWPNGTRTSWTSEDPALCLAHLHSRKGSDPEEWPEDLRVREWPV